jgi:hypothetical protein
MLDTLATAAYAFIALTFVAAVVADYEAPKH